MLDNLMLFDKSKSLGQMLVARLKRRPSPTQLLLAPSPDTPIWPNTIRTKLYTEYTYFVLVATTQPTTQNNLKQLWLGWYYYRLKKTTTTPPHHHTGTDYILSHFKTNYGADFK